MNGNFLDEIKLKLRQFADERDWSQFHSPKNLCMALAGETGELLEHFQWLTEDESGNLSDEKLVEVGEEIADIFIYLVRLSDRLNVDLAGAVKDKIRKNEKKYPAEKVKGSSKKYTEYKTIN